MYIASKTTERAQGNGNAGNAFNGMLIKMRGEKNFRHHGVHIHAWRNDDNVYVFDVKTRRVIRKKGKFTRDEIIHVAVVHCQARGGTPVELGTLESGGRFVVQDCAIRKDCDDEVF